MKKRLLSLFLALTLIVGVMPLGALAAGEHTTHTDAFDGNCADCAAEKSTAAAKRSAMEAISLTGFAAKVAEIKEIGAWYDTASNPQKTEFGSAASAKLMTLLGNVCDVAGHNEVKPCPICTATSLIEALPAPSADAVTANKAKVQEAVDARYNLTSSQAALVSADHLSKLKTWENLLKLAELEEGEKSWSDQEAFLNPEPCKSNGSHSALQVKKAYKAGDVIPKYNITLAHDTLTFSHRECRNCGLWLDSANRPMPTADVEKILSENGYATAALVISYPSSSAIKPVDGKKKTIEVDMKDITTFSLSAANDSNFADQGSLSWYSSNAQVVAVDKNGKLTLRKPGTVTISVSSNRANVSGDSLTIIVKSNQTVGNKLVAKLTVGGTAKSSIIMGESQPIQVTVTEQGTNQNVTSKVTFTSSDEKVATIASTGVVTVQENVSNKTVTFTATLKDGSMTRTASVNLTILPKNSLDIKLYDGSTADSNVYNSEEAQEVALTVKEYDGSAYTKTLDASEFNWSSDNSEVASIRSAGKIRIPKGAAGVATIKAEYKKNPVISVEFTVTAYSKAVKLLTGSATIKGYAVNDSTQLVFNQNPSDKLTAGAVTLLERKGTSDYATSQNFTLTINTESSADGVTRYASLAKVANKQITPGVYYLRFTVQTSAATPKEYTFDLTVTVTDKDVDFRVETLKKLNLADGNSYGEIRVTPRDSSLRITDVSIKTHPEFSMVSGSAIEYGKGMTLKYVKTTPSSVKVNNNKLTLQVKLSDLASEATFDVDYTIETESSQRSLKAVRLDLYKSFPEAKAKAYFSSNYAESSGSSTMVKVNSTGLTIEEPKDSKITLSYGADGYLIASFKSVSDLPKSGSYVFTLKNVRDMDGQRYDDQKVTVVVNGNDTAPVANKSPELRLGANQGSVATTTVDFSKHDLTAAGYTVIWDKAPESKEWKVEFTGSTVKVTALKDLSVGSRIAINVRPILVNGSTKVRMESINLQIQVVAGSTT